MKKLYILSILSLSCLIFACNAEKSEQKDTATSEQETPTANEDDLFVRLSAEIISTPTKQAHHDKNAIINYALDSLLDVYSTNSGLYYQIEAEGEGDLLKWGDRISADYTGRFLNGKLFDSSYKKGKPLTFYIGNMVDGWNEGLQLLRPNGKATFLLPSHLAYGEEGFIRPKGDTIVPPNTVLRFDVVIRETGL